MKNEIWSPKFIAFLVCFSIGVGIVTGIIITAHHFGKMGGKAFPVFILTMAAGGLIAGIIKYLVDKRRGINTTTSKLTLAVTLCVMIGLLIGAGIGLISYHYFLKPNVYEISNVSYKVGGCERAKSEKLFSVSYDEQNKTLNAEVWVNCCGVEVVVEKEGSTYKILEKQYGELCRCVCKRKVTIFNVSKEAEIRFLDKDGNSFILTPSVEFCGWSSYGKCNSNEDCITNGCSAQICRSRFEEPIITICEWKKCYEASKYRVTCKCIEGKCQWVREQ